MLFSKCLKLKQEIYKDEGRGWLPSRILYWPSLLEEKRIAFGGYEPQLEIINLKLERKFEKSPLLQKLKEGEDFSEEQFVFQRKQDHGNTSKLQDLYSETL